MDQGSHDEPDEPTARSQFPPVESRDAVQMEAHKEAMLEMLRSNTEYMDSVTRLHRDPDLEAAGDTSSKLPPPPNFFFYGSLMDPDVLQVIAEISSNAPAATGEPELHRASIKGFRLKMWGVYPTLVPGSAEDTVQAGHVLAGRE
ncbi:hypothetical protein VMCG_01609 [Cytospora schulzeri]|uniref:Gamma-glutamylcyclotransferase AIG2-like domain-containing protein n=1 Tax=Cytospora schulzeri TaxID=448051 RepID=A0A423X446_9PEZI|nr:hypothetical protein VMCG_01609 [Valsa malicola]